MSASAVDSVLAVPVTTIDGRDTTLGELGGSAYLIVNVASKCGFTPQYTGLEELHQRFGPRGLRVVGVPCNQFLLQEPGSNAEIAQSCSINWGVTFPLLSKSKVNGRHSSELYAALRSTPDASGKAGKVAWNFEKFLVDGQGVPVGRYRSTVEPSDPELIAAIERLLPAE